VPEPGSEEPATTVVGLPERLDRPMRFGPFRSIRDGLKFAAYASIGAVAAALAGPVWWLPFLGAGFVLSVYQRDGQPVDEQAGAFLAGRWRAQLGGSPSSARCRAAVNGPSTLRLASGRRVILLEAGGIPVAFLPPRDARHLFDRFRIALGRLGAGAYLHVGTAPLPVAPYLPPTPRAAASGPERLAREGYREVVRLLCEHRAQRRVRVALWARATGATADAELDGLVRQFRSDLEQIGIVATPLAGGALREAAATIGWTGVFA
jgi:hypothetical protein